MTVSSQKIAGVIILLFGSILLIADLALVRSFWGSIPISAWFMYLIWYAIIICAYGMIMSGGMVLTNESKWGSGLALIGGIIVATIGAIELAIMIGMMINAGPFPPLEVVTMLIDFTIHFTLLGVIIIIGATIGKRTD